MRYLSVCSGIEAATVAWKPLGWKAAAFSDIEEFPRRLLKYHYPDTPVHGDFTTIGMRDYGAIDLLVGGTPCQAFSIAGLRRGFADDRGNLTLAFLQLLKRKAPKWVVWENVTGILSHDGGRTFATFLGGLGECGYGFAYRVLDAQYFGVPQRRRRVFVVGCFRDWRSAAEVLFEPQSLSGFITPEQKSGQDSTKPPAPRLTTYTMTNNWSTFLNNISCTLTVSAKVFVATGGIIRKLTPIEYERLQGFPDNYTLISENTPDAPRCAALGNSMAVPVMRWIGKRIQMVENKKW